jgi:D-alanyl-D-alanine carboxypeptidase (penicillin-binding protein 5/6)
MNLVPGDELTSEQLLYGLLVQSGGDAARALARNVGAALLDEEPDAADPDAARARFVDEMNRLAASLELANTHFRNPDGHDQEGQYTSARDLAVLAAEVMADDALATIVSTATYEFTVASGTTYTLRNSNELVQGKEAIGIKTGSEVKAGACLAAAVRFSGNQVVTIVLGSTINWDDVTDEVTVDKRYDDTRAILETLESEFRWVSPTDPKSVPGLDDALAAWEVTLGDGPELVVPAGGADVSFRLRLAGEGDGNGDGEPVGRVLFFAGSTFVGERPLVPAGASVSRARFAA